MAANAGAVINPAVSIVLIVLILGGSIYMRTQGGMRSRAGMLTVAGILLVLVYFAFFASPTLG